MDPEACHPLSQQYQPGEGQPPSVINDPGEVARKLSAKGGVDFCVALLRAGLEEMTG